MDSTEWTVKGLDWNWEKPLFIGLKLSGSRVEAPALTGVPLREIHPGCTLLPPRCDGTPGHEPPASPYPLSRKCVLFEAQVGKFTRVRRASFTHRNRTCTTPNGRHFLSFSPLAQLLKASMPLPCMLKPFEVRSSAQEFFGSYLSKMLCFSLQSRSRRKLEFYHLNVLCI